MEKRERVMLAIQALGLLVQLMVLGFLTWLVLTNLL